MKPEPLSLAESRSRAEKQLAEIRYSGDGVPQSLNDITIGLSARVENLQNMEQLSQLEWGVEVASRARIPARTAGRVQHQVATRAVWIATIPARRFFLKQNPTYLSKVISRGVVRDLAIFSAYLSLQLGFLFLQTFDLLCERLDLRAQQIDMLSQNGGSRNTLGQIEEGGIRHS